MSYAHDTGLAATWKTSVDRLSAESRRMLDRLAMLSPDPIPDTLLDVAVPDETVGYDAHRARAALYAYSLIARAGGEGGSAKGFVMHRLVQDFARRAMTLQRFGEALQEAIRWVNAAFVADPADVRNWAVLDPLLPHALTVALHGDGPGASETTGRLLHEAGLLLKGKARHVEAERIAGGAVSILAARYGPDHTVVATALNALAEVLREMNRLDEAEPLLRRALAIDERACDPNHPKVSVRLNNLGLLLKAANRFVEAELSLRRALAIDEAHYGPDHTSVAIHLSNLAQLLRATGRASEAESLYRRALAIEEASCGPDHPTVAIDLNNLALLLKDINRPGEARLLYRRAVQIFEKWFRPDDPRTVMVRENLAALGISRGQRT